jgi:type IV secretion system protein VirB10
MVAMLIFSLMLVQGPKRLEVAEDAKILPPIIVPAGTVIPISLSSRITTKNAKDGDRVYGKTVFPITVDNRIIIPEGTNVRGKVVEVVRPGMVKGKAELTLSFQTLVLPNGRTLEIYSSLGSAGFAGEKKGEATIEGESSKGRDAKDTATGAATGGVVGVLVGGRTGGAIGAAGGAVGAILNRGKDLVIDPGTILEIVLDRPLEP